MKESDKATTRQARMNDNLCVATCSTHAYATHLISDSDKAVAFAGARLDVNLIGPPNLLWAMEGESPYLGIPRTGADAYVELFGNRVRGDREMRDALGIKPVVDLISEAEISSPGQLWSGLGNAGMNGYCMAWQAPSKLFYSLQDLPLLESGWEFDACIWVEQSRWEVRFARVQFVRSGSGWAPLVDGEPLAGARLIVTGQRLVERGVAIDPTSDALTRHALSYVDKRHLLLNAYTRLLNRTTHTRVLDSAGQAVRRDFGLEQILRNPELLKKAIEGAVVPLRLELCDVDEVCYDVEPEDLIEALRAKSYNLCDDLRECKERQQAGERGLAFVDAANGVCYLVYALSPYPLHFLAVREDGDAVLIDAVIGGASNNAGSTVVGLAKDLVASGYGEGLLLDNGGDAVLVYRGSHSGNGWAHPNGPCALIPSSLRRTQWAALMLYQARTGDGIAVCRGRKAAGNRFCLEWSHILP